MRKLVVSSLLAFAVLSWSGCKEADPNAFETHIASIKDVNGRAAGLSGLEALVKAITSSPGDHKERLDEFVTKVIPVFEEVWDQVTPEQQVTMLNMLTAVGRPEGANLWIKALALDGSDAARKRVLAALQGIQKAKPPAVVDAVVALMQGLVKDPSKDKGKTNEGELRLELATTLGELRDKKAVPVLIEAMNQTKENQPVSVHREAAKALGMIKDGSATDALLTVTFRVPDAPSTTDIANRSKLALVSIGEPAVPRLKEMLAGKFTEVNELAQKHDVDLLVVQQTAVGILGAMGTNAAIDELIAFMPQDDCVAQPAKKPEKKKKKDEEEEPDEEDAANASLRAFVANTLGLIGDPKGVPALCKCINATHNPGDMFPITEALGRIGGDEAFKCLAETTKTGEYDPEALDNSDFRYQIRWEAGRFATLVATPEQLPALQDAMKGASAANEKKVAEEMKKWEPGVKTLETCKADLDCYKKVLNDQNADWFAREKAAFEVVRLAPPGDKAAALDIAKAFKVRNPDARVTMALLVPRVLKGAKCPECAAALDDVMKGEKGSMDSTLQLSVLTARSSIARIE